jgi:LmbE family N-acetylglucosaminyl deacetylase
MPHASSTYTVVFFHAHPDDEALMTGGTMARLAAEGHRVVLVTATAGERGLAASTITTSNALAEVRLAELQASATALGCARTVVLGFADSGSTPVDPDAPDHDGPTSGTFASMPVDVAAQALADVLREENADALTTYDAAGGYGHPDHVQVHRVGARAAEMAGLGLVLEATVDRRLLQRALRVGRWLTPRNADFDPSRFDRLYGGTEEITHRVNVRRFTDQKRTAMLAHHSQGTSDGPVERGLTWMLRLPRPLYRLVFGREWFIERGRRPDPHPLDDVLATLRK